jgi:hypothetical protein
LNEIPSKAIIYDVPLERFEQVAALYPAVGSILGLDMLYSFRYFPKARSALIANKLDRQINTEVAGGMAIVLSLLGFNCCSHPVLLQRMIFNLAQGFVLLIPDSNDFPENITRTFVQTLVQCSGAYASRSAYEVAVGDTFVKGLKEAMLQL